MTLSQPTACVDMFQCIEGCVMIVWLTKHFPRRHLSLEVGSLSQRVPPSTSAPDSVYLTLELETHCSLHLSPLATKSERNISDSKKLESRFLTVFFWNQNDSLWNNACVSAALFQTEIHFISARL
eukprot:m.26046 g.26046  ORF g.26046 m.26046 type:complete len:125 (+) comp29100_c0_seq2:205-579(+)